MAAAEPRPGATAPFGAELRRLRLRAGLTQERLAERAGVSVATISALEEGLRRRPYPNTLRVLAEALELSQDQRAAFIETVAAPRPPAARATARPASEAAWSVSTLPVGPTTLIGRDAEVASAAALLAPPAPATRLLNMTGPGGVGKTRLAVAVAARLSDAYADGVAFVDLAPIRDHRLVPDTVARALGLGLGGGRGAWELVLTHLESRQLLLVLDNFEQLTASAPLLPELLANCPLVAVVVTSRTALRLLSEHRFPVAPLPTPPRGPNHTFESAAASPAVRLFVERAQAVVPEFTLDTGNVDAVAGVCRQIDGIPLALELAAARVQLVRPEALLRRLERRLPVLTGGMRDQPERQRTLRDTLAWSHDLLGPAEQTLFRRLAVFVGGGPIEAVEAVCVDDGLPAEDVLEVLQTLLESSLIQVQGEQSAHARPRVAMLETVREFAEQQLVASGEADLVRRRHSDWYVDMAEAAMRELTGPGQVEGFRLLTEELDNLRAVRAWSHQAPDGATLELRLAAALGRYLNTCAPGPEARAWFSDALARDTGSVSTERAVLLNWSGQVEFLHGQPATGEARLREAVAVARQQSDQHVLTLALRHLALYASDLPLAREALEEAAALARAAGDWRELALALAFLGIVPERSGDLATAEQLYTEALSFARQAGDVSSEANVLLRLGGLRLARAERASAAALLNEAEALSEAIDYRMHMEKAHRQLAQLALGEGDQEAAVRHTCVSLEMVRDSGRQADALWPLRVAARVVASLGAPASATQLLAAEAASRAEHVGRSLTLWTLSAVPGADEDPSALRAALGEHAFTAAWEAGARLTLEDAIALALRTLRP
ncbi:MAG: XRE family transcriptional regulator [Chloroflexi bacterium]|nr:XRE family transcriptional regulator [Chloroflexota bacterium]